MATTIGSHGVAAFTNPSNGDALDATVVKGNDNTLRSAYVDHDNDPGIHVQSSSLASRPTAGTAGRKWLTTDTGSVKLWHDTGSTWEEVSYVPASGAATVESLTVTNGMTVDTSTLVVDATNNRVGVATASPTVALDVTGAAKVSNGLTVTAGGATVSAGGVTVTGNSTITGTLGGLTGLTVASGGASITGNSSVTGTFTATTFSGSGASLTSIPASAISSGTLDSARLPTTFSSATTFSAGGAAVVISNGGRINFSANGTENTTDLLAFNTQYTTTGGATAPNMDTAPSTGDTWRWVRVSYNGSTAWIPMLVDAV